MTFLTRPFLGFIFAVQPVWLPLLILDVATIAVLIFRERLEPRALIFWISVTVVVPFIGPLLYLLFGCNLISDRIFSRKEEAERSLLASDAVMTGDARILCMGGADICTGGNDVGLRWSAGDFIDDMVSDIRSAKRRIGIMSRWLDYPEAVIDALAEKAREGLDVMAMTSAAGFGRTRGARMLKKAGAEVCTFRSKLIAVVGMRPANRNLRSMLVIDGKVAYIGKGAVMRVEGPAAHRAMLRYSADWAFATDSEPVCDLDVSCGTGDAEVQLVAGGPDAGHDAPLRACFEHVIASAKRSLMVIAPYLTPNDEIYSAVKMAVFSGVDVTVLLPHKGRHWYQSWNSLSASNPLMMAGVKVFFADKVLDRFVMVADGRICASSSGSFTTRSLRDDMNICAVTYSQKTSREMESFIQEELKGAVECLPEEYRRRTLPDMARIAVARMLMFLN